MVLSAAGLALPLVSTPMGPLVSKDDGRTEPLAWALNLGVSGSISLSKALRERSPIAGPEVTIRPLGARDDRPALSAGWRELAGSALGDDAWVISIGFLERDFGVPRAVLLELVEALARLRAEAPKPPGPWLFRAHPQWHEPAPGEDEALRPLEQVANRADPAERPALLQALEQHGILADAWWDERGEWLGRWGLPTLAAYARAARGMHLYLRSAERRRHLEAARSEPILGARISLDWFRNPSVPRGFEPHDWLGACERALRDAPSTEGPEGEVFTRVGDAWCRIRWRRDDGRTPAIVETSLDGDA